MRWWEGEGEREGEGEKEREICRELTNTVK